MAVSERAQTPEADLGSLNQLLAEAIPNGYVRAEAIQGSIVLRGTVPSTSDVSRAVMIANSMIAAQPMTPSPGMASGRAHPVLGFYGPESMMWRIKTGMLMCDLQTRWQGASQSPTWSLKSSSRVNFRAFLISSLMVEIFMPSSQGAEQPAIILPLASFLTWQIMHEVNGSRPSR